MIKHSETRHLKYSSGQMFDLVANIESYPDFIPWCKQVKIISKTKDELRQCDTIEAEMLVSFKVFSESFSSRVTLDPDYKVITVEYITGPFNFLNNKWSFASSNGGCLINFYVEFEFKSRILQRLIGVVFNEAMRRIVVAFEKRADELFESDVPTQDN